MADQSKEYLVCVDRQGLPKGSELRSICHSDPAYTHCVVHVMVKDTKGNTLAQLRSGSKDIQPGKWDMAVGGHLIPGETIESGAAREYQEELGKPAPCLEFLHEYIWVSDVESELVRTYTCVDEGPFNFDTEEIDDLRFFSDFELEQLWLSGKITNNFKFELARCSGGIRTDLRVPANYPVQEIISCQRCRRLVTYRNQMEKPRRFRDQTYWNRPVPGFGDMACRILIMGLAPGANGANRTGRAFTGDESGVFLYDVLYRTGLASQPSGLFRGDGLTLHDVFITNVVKCVPPQNKPLNEEIRNCSRFLKSELAALLKVKLIITLGSVAFRAIAELAKNRYESACTADRSFEHGKIHQFSDSFPGVMSLYHPSLRNQRTHLIDSVDFLKKFDEAVRFVERG